MKLKMLEESDELMSTFKRASTSLEDNHTLFRKPAATVRDGSRHASLDAYLKPVLRRRNLHVLLKTQAVSVSLVFSLYRRHMNYSPVIWESARYF